MATQGTSDDGIVCAWKIDQSATIRSSDDESDYASREAGKSATMRFSLERPVESETGTSVQQAAVGESGHLIKRTLAGARVDKIDYANRKAEKSATLRLSRETS